MPKMDGTGPFGTGPIGWGRGPCRRGFEFRRGFWQVSQFGRRFGWSAQSAPVELTKEEKIKILKAEKEDIEKALKKLEE